MADAEDPEIIFSDLSRDVLIDGHAFTVEIYRSSGDHGWVLSVMNAFGTLTISDDPPFLADGLAWRAFETLSDKDGPGPFYNDKERRRLGL